MVRRRKRTPFREGRVPCEVEATQAWNLSNEFVRPDVEEQEVRHELHYHALRAEFSEERQRGLRCRSMIHTAITYIRPDRPTCEPLLYAIHRPSHLPRQMHHLLLQALSCSCHALLPVGSTHGRRFKRHLPGRRAGSARESLDARRPSGLSQTAPAAPDTVPSPSHD